jgi:hypothetical protein
VKPWHERLPDIYEYERAFWLDNNFTQAPLRAETEVSFTGTITVRVKLDDRLQKRTFELRVLYPPGYPYVPPRVEFLNPRSPPRSRWSAVSLPRFGLEPELPRERVLRSD